MINLQELIRDALAEIRKDFKGSDEEFQVRISENSTEIKFGAAKSFVSGLFKFYEETRIREIHDSFSKFLGQNRELHKEGFDMFLMFIDLIVTINMDITKRFNVDKFPEDERLKFEQLLQLHIKACQVSNEIYTMIGSGYSDAALARWRTLHETCVVFISLFKNDVKVSRMFYDFQFIEKLKRVKTFQIHHGTLNWKAIEDAAIQTLEQKRVTLLQQYGKEFENDYGWTKDFLPKGKRHFAELENFAELSYLRPFYQWANKGVHSGPESIFSRLGFDNIREIPRSILAGPSRYGMVDPMQFTTYSMRNITSWLISLDDTLESNLLLSMLDQLHNLIATAMIEAKNKLPE